MSILKVGDNCVIHGYLPVCGDDIIYGVICNIEGNIATVLIGAGGEVKVPLLYLSPR